MEYGGKKDKTMHYNKTSRTASLFPFFSIFAPTKTHIQRRRQGMYISEGKLFCLEHMNNMTDFRSFKGIWVDTSQSYKQRAL
jgi:hypothetical protein